MRILHVVGNMDYGGVETLLIEIYRRVDREKLQFDFLCHNYKEGKFDKEIKELGGHIHRVSSIRNSSFKAYKQNLLNFFKMYSTEYSVVHAHKSGNNGLILNEARKANIKHRISHSHIHNAKFKFPQNLLIAFSISLIPKSVTHSFACSVDAARYLYHSGVLFDNCKIMNNAIDTHRFKYYKESADIISQKYNLKGKVVFGHVGRFEEQKNQLFVVDIFKALQHHFPDSVLLLIGVGSMEEKVQVYAEKQGINNKVLFLGAQPDIPALMSAMDVFLFPSLFEGLGIVAIEAQSMGLPVFASDNIPKETKLTDLITYLPLTDSAETWAGVIMDLIKNNRDRPRDKYSAIIKEKGYDIEDVALELQNFYIELDIKS